MWCLGRDWFLSFCCFSCSHFKLESASTSTLEDRVKRNIHSLQRTPAALEKNFMQRWSLFFLCFCAGVNWTLVPQGERPPAHAQFSLQDPSPKELLNFCAAAHSVVYTSGTVNVFVMRMIPQADLSWRAREPLYPAARCQISSCSPPWFIPVLYIVVIRWCWLIIASYTGQVICALYLWEQKTYFC